MINNLSHRYILILCFACGFALLGCRKEKEDCPVTNSPIDWREQFVGRYNVYDTLGNYRYSMEILKSSIPDSLYVINWGDAFNVYVAHDDTDPTPIFNFGSYFPAYDHLGNRWSVSDEYDQLFQSNYLIKDTLRMSYVMNNIAFYAEDGVPFFTWSYREYGVKQ